MTDRSVGMVLLGGTLTIFTYYTLWVIALPFVDEEQEFIHAWFPAKHYAVGLPLMAGVVGLLCIGGFVSIVFMKANRKEKTS